MKPTLERGQALILVALAFVGLAAFIGLAVDAGILFTQIGHLRRATDAASLAAANQFREGREAIDIETAANEFINLNSLNPATAHVFICTNYFPPGTPAYMHDPSLCPPSGEAPRKFVRVTAQMPVTFAFLPIIGFNSMTISANSISEAASVDLVLVIDNSASMAFDLCTDGFNNDGENPLDPNEIDDCNGYPTPDNSQVGALSDADVAQCNWNRAQRLFFGVPTDPANDCHPFEEVRAASQALLARMKFPFDRMAVVTFSQVATVNTSLLDGTNAIVVGNQLNAMEVAQEPLVGVGPCHMDLGDPRGCTSTNAAGALQAAGAQFGFFTRPEAVWIVVLLSDGGANAALQTGQDPLLPESWICPGSTPGQPEWIQPFCRDITASTRHDSGDLYYDADDAARDWAEFVGCPDANTPQPTACHSPGQGAVIFTIGLGQLMVNSQACAPFYGGACEPDLGEQLMRYVAGAGDDADPGTPAYLDPCAGVAVGHSCGNYYFSPTGAGLMEVFEAIASRIFTRITH